MIEHTVIQENYNRILAHIAEITSEVGRKESDVTLLAVTKYVGTEEIRVLHQCGCHHFGESRSQRLTEKVQSLGTLPVSWHFIGPLQKNKARRVVSICSLIHSGTDMDLLETLERVSAEEKKRTAILLEVNISGDTNKQGFKPDDFPDVLKKMWHFKHLYIGGFMGMSALGATTHEARAQFATLRILRDRAREMIWHSGTVPEVFLSSSDNGIPEEESLLQQLSMGMSDDYPQAIREGATVVRIGSALFST